MNEVTTTTESAGWVPVLTKEDIVRIAASAGYRARFRRYRRKNNEVVDYVTCIIDSGDTELTLGSFDEVTALTEGGLRARIASRVAQGRQRRK